MKTRSTLTILLLAILLGVSALVALAAPTDDPSAPAALAAPSAVCISTGSGNWSAAIWSCAGGPTINDIVIINDGHTVTLDTNGSAYQLIVGGGTSGMLTHASGSQTLSVGAGGVSVSNGATFNAPETLNLAGNLTNNGTFNATGSTVVMNGTGAPQSIGGSNLTFNNLQIATNAVVNLTTNATVNGTLTLDSDLNVSSGYALTMESSATTQGNADVVGVTKRAHSFTPGTAYSFGSPYTTIQFASGGTLPSAITVQLFKTTPGGLANAVQRYYSITPTGGSGYTFDLKLHYRDSELGSVNENNLQMWQQVNGLWTLRSVTSRDTTNNWVQKTGLTSFSLWALSDSGAPTAVTLSMLDARADSPSALPFIGLGALAVVMLGVVLWRRTMCQ